MQPSTLELLRENRAASASAPHGYADAKVLREVAARLMIDEAALCGCDALHADAIRTTARTLLVEDTAHRRAVSGEPALPGAAAR
jgi:hypothetical protein